MLSIIMNCNEENLTLPMKQWAIDSDEVINPQYPCSREHVRTKGEGIGIYPPEIF
jgi:hypothetical protein